MFRLPESVSIHSSIRQYMSIEMDDGEFLTISIAVDEYYNFSRIQNLIETSPYDIAMYDSGVSESYNTNKELFDLFELYPHIDHFSINQLDSYI